MELNLYLYQSRAPDMLIFSLDNDKRATVKRPFVFFNYFLSLSHLIRLHYVLQRRPAGTVSPERSRLANTKYGSR